MDKETKLGLTVPWIGLICFPINIITTIIYLFNSSFGFVIPISIFFGFLTILSLGIYNFHCFSAYLEPNDTFRNLSKSL